VTTQVRRWAAQGGQARWDSVAARPGSTDAGWERELIGGAHASVRGEREDAKDGRREPRKKMYSMEYAKGARGPTKGTVAYGRGGLAQLS
jgi:hypothetical protein